MKSCLKITIRLTEAATIWKNDVLIMAAKYTQRKYRKEFRTAGTKRFNR